MRRLIGRMRCTATPNTFREELLVGLVGSSGCLLGGAYSIVIILRPILSPVIRVNRNSVIVRMWSVALLLLNTARGPPVLPEVDPRLHFSGSCVSLSLSGLARRSFLVHWGTLARSSRVLMSPG